MVNIWCTIYKTNKEIDAHLVKGLLESNAISCKLELLPIREGSSSILDLYRLKVLKSKVKRARDILNKVK